MPEPEDIDYCVDCDTLTPATDEIVTDTYHVAGETYMVVEKVCARHKALYEMAAEETDIGASDEFVETR